MAENPDLLDMIVKRTANLFKIATIAEKAAAQLERIERRENAESPSNTNGEIEPDE